MPDEQDQPQQEEKRRSDIQDILGSDLAKELTRALERALSEKKENNRKLAVDDVLLTEVFDFLDQIVDSWIDLRAKAAGNPALADDVKAIDGAIDKIREIARDAHRKVKSCDSKGGSDLIQDLGKEIRDLKKKVRELRRRLG